ncbi:MAG: CotH kinase family protein [Clostridia bacterium]|nr:CotH kinase family protein [Clostridia bacterium]
MKYKIIGIVLAICLVTASVIYDGRTTAAQPRERYHQHLDAPKPVACKHTDDTFCSHLPVIEINTDGQIIPGRSIVDPKTDKVLGHVTTPDGGTEITAHLSSFQEDGVNHHLTDKPTFSSDILIHVRGASSRRFDKSNYAVDFITDKGKNKNVSLLGMDPHYKWAFHGPYLDKTLIRNYMWYNIGAEMMGYAPNCRFFELFINGEDLGLYLATEKITNGQIDGSRIDIKKNAKQNTFTGYLLKYDNQDEVPVKNLDNFSTYARFPGNYLSVVYPNGKHMTPELANSISLDFSKFEKALFSYDYDDESLGYRSYIDVDNFAKYVIINEITCNYDAGNRSTYFYKTMNGQFKTCIWDFDACCGNYLRDTGDESFYFTNRPWFARLLQDEYFTDSVVSTYHALRKTYLSDEYLMNYIDETLAYLGPAIDRNWEKWGYTFDQSKDLLRPTERNVRSFDEAIAQYKGFLLKRGKWLDENIDALYQYSAKSAIKNINEHTR